MPEKKQFLNFPFELKEINNEDSKFFVFEGYASTFGNIDLGNDIVEKGAFTESLSKSPVVPILWQHNMQEPVGTSMELFEDSKGLYIKARLPKTDTLVSGRIVPQMEVGSIKEMSIGFFIDDYEIVEDRRMLKKINLFEVSLVTKAMNPRALVTGFKSFKDVELTGLKDIEGFLKEGGLSNNEAKTLISKIKEFTLECDAQEKAKEQRDAEAKRLLDSIQDLTNFIKTTK